MLCCIFNDGHHANIEIQIINKTKEISKRLTYYSSKLYASQPIKGEDYADLKENYVILISDATVLPKRNEYLHDIQYRFPDGESLNPELKIIILELSKMHTDIIIPIELTPIERWGIYFKNCN